MKNNRISFITVNSNFFAFHRYKTAPKKVAFLRSMHPHSFFVILTIETKNNLREIEFYLCRYELDKILNKFQGIRVMWSCEDFCDKIYEKISKIYGKNRMYNIKVFEDNQMGAEVKYDST